VYADGISFNKLLGCLCYLAGYYH